MQLGHVHLCARSRVCLNSRFELVSVVPLHRCRTADHFAPPTALTGPKALLRPLRTITLQISMNVVKRTLSTSSARRAEQTLAEFGVRVSVHPAATDIDLVA